MLRKVANIANYFFARYMKPKVNKSRIIVSFNKLTQEQVLLFSKQYQEGYTSYIQKINKPSGEIIYVVPMETDDAIYMVKMDVKVDAKLSEEEFDKEIFSVSKIPDFGEAEHQEEEEEDKQGKDTFVLVHGDYANDKIDEEDDEEEDVDEEGENQ